MLDTIVAVLCALSNLVLAIIAFEIGLRPPSEQKKTRVRWLFISISVLALVSAGFSALRADRAQNNLQVSVNKVDTNVGHIETDVQSLRAETNASPKTTAQQVINRGTRMIEPTGFLQLAKIQYVKGRELFTVGQPLELNVYYINKGSVPVDNGYVTGSLYLVPKSSFSQAQVDSYIIHQFEASATQQTDAGSTIGVNELVWITPSFTEAMTPQQAYALEYGGMTLYVLSHAKWKGSQGNFKDVLNCMWLQPPMEEHPRLGNLVWHDCLR